MNPVTKPQTTRQQALEAHALMSEEDVRWAQRKPSWRERQLAIAWPEDLLENFGLRMAAHGMCISRTLMLCDRRYALQQLVHGQNLNDEGLRALSTVLFRHFEPQRAGVLALH